MGRLKIALVAALSLAAIRCGDNITETGSGGGFPPPTNLAAFSADSQSIRLQWSAPTSVSDSSFKDILILWGSNQDSVAKTALTYTVSGLTPGEVLITLFSRDKTGGVGVGAGLKWAPAVRFPNAYSIFENRGVLSGGDAAIDCGTNGGSPTTMPLDNNAQFKADFYCYGGAGQIQNPQLQLVSADQYVAGFKQTLFSTVSHASPTLDYYLTAFPSASTFTESSITISAGPIYYAQLSDANNAKHYARILVTVITGSAPGRSVNLRISSQRLVGVPYADAGEWVPDLWQRMGIPTEQQG